MGIDLFLTCNKNVTCNEVIGNLFRRILDEYSKNPYQLIKYKYFSYLKQFMYIMIIL